VFLTNGVDARDDTNTGTTSGRHADGFGRIGKYCRYGIWIVRSLSTERAAQVSGSGARRAGAVNRSDSERDDGSSERPDPDPCSCSFCDRRSRSGEYSGSCSRQRASGRSRRSAARSQTTTRTPGREILRVLAVTNLYCAGGTISAHPRGRG
jgi:hypothetical protein